MILSSVIAGDYKSASILMISGFPNICEKHKHIPLNSKYIESYEVITDEHRKSASSAVARGAIGAVLLGPIGLLGGAISGKKKGKYTIAIKFRDGKNSLLEVNEKIYKIIMRACFNPSENSVKIETSNDFVEVNDTNYINELKQLKELVDQGILTEAEFNKKKHQILSNMSKK
ncbi:SHOCT domain-containing protein [Mariniplasma anaerobium]|uniref:Uncharacterized protein n=1 Tax=Mariniplasma anaerobium TaxID=2735436 RepID=A0A7U9TJ87_9MOLU|nr:SHOCT domain-containing protein [Mariniplasma anaerobium]BCR35201.1 hypothetical protein MPAN_000940 [Mariniplasma anaerobium]